MADAAQKAAAIIQAMIDVHAHERTAGGRLWVLLGPKGLADARVALVPAGQPTPALSPDMLPVDVALGIAMGAAWVQSGAIGRDDSDEVMAMVRRALDGGGEPGAETCSVCGEAGHSVCGAEGGSP